MPLVTGLALLKMAEAEDEGTQTPEMWRTKTQSVGYAFGTVSRSEDSFVIELEKEADSQRFKMSDQPVQLATLAQALQEAWSTRPDCETPKPRARSSDVRKSSWMPQRLPRCAHRVSAGKRFRASWGLASALCSESPRKPGKVARKTFARQLSEPLW